MTLATQLLEDLRAPTRSPRDAAPEAWSAFGDLYKAAFADGALPAVVKELMALAIAVANHCDGCVAHHARAAARLGATREQVADALSVALLMGGGPASVTAPRAWEVYEHYAARYHRPDEDGHAETGRRTLSSAHRSRTGAGAWSRPASRCAAPAAT